MEIWKDVEGFEGIYKISDYGRLKSFKTHPKGYVLKNTNKTGGYFSVVLASKKRIRSARLHRLVAEAFLPNPNNLPQVNHIDGNKQNNNIANLEWVTAKENIEHAILNNPNILGAINKYNKYEKPRIVQQYNSKGELMAEYPNCKLASMITGICHRNIHQVAAGTEYKKGLTRKQAGGYVWKFKEEVSINAN